MQWDKIELHEFHNLKLKTVIKGSPLYPAGKKLRAGDMRKAHVARHDERVKPSFSTASFEVRRKERDLINVWR